MNEELIPVEKSASQYEEDENSGANNLIDLDAIADKMEEFFGRQFNHDYIKMILGGNALIVGMIIQYGLNDTDIESRIANNISKDLSEMTFPLYGDTEEYNLLFWKKTEAAMEARASEILSPA